MIAAAALSARGIVPEMMIDLALLGPYFINMPLAPAEGLIVVNSGYAGNSNGQVCTVLCYVRNDWDVRTRRIITPNLLLLTQYFYNHKHLKS